jgi:hypothetical protein
MSFRPLKTFTMTWWQTGAFKAGTMGLWLAVGAHWHALLDPYALWLALLGLVCLTYVAVIWWRQ